LQEKLKEPETKADSTAELLKIKLPDYLTKAVVPTRARAVSDEEEQEEEIPGNATLRALDSFVKIHNLPKMAADYQELLKKVSDPKLSSHKKNSYKKAWQSIFDKYKNTLEELRRKFEKSLTPELTAAVKQ